MPRRKSQSTRLEQSAGNETDTYPLDHDALIAAFVQQQVIDRLLGALHPPCIFFSPWAYQTALEVPISRNERILGFADMVVTATRTLRCHLYTGIGRPGGHRAERHTLNGAGPDPVPHHRTDEPGECCQDAYWYLRSGRATEQGGFLHVPDALDMVLEFKTTVPSVGELLRQVNTYRAHRPADYYVVVTQGACPQRQLLHTEYIQVIEWIGGAHWHLSLATPDRCG
jgi:hypothetical protein